MAKACRQTLQRFRPSSNLCLQGCLGSKPLRPERARSHTPRPRGHTDINPRLLTLMYDVSIQEPFCGRFACLSYCRIIRFFFFANYLIQSRPRTCTVVHCCLRDSSSNSIALDILINHHLACARVSHHPRKSIFHPVGTGCSRPRSRSKADPCEEFDERPDFARIF